MPITLCHNDLPSDILFPSDGLLSIDTETDGLDVRTCNLWLAQVGDSEGNVWLVKFDGTNYAAPNLKKMLEDERFTKIFHFARFDLAMLQRKLNLSPITPTVCTKIASKLVNPEAGKHNLRTLVHKHCDVLLDKGEQCSNWAAPELSESQKAYAASDVLYLAKIWQDLKEELAEKGLEDTFQSAMKFLSTRVQMDLAGFPETDLFAHH